MTSQFFQYHLLPTGIATLIFDTADASVNILSYASLQAFDDILTELRAHQETRMLLIRSGKPNTYVVGADLKVLEKALSGSSDSLEKVKQMIEMGSKAFCNLTEMPFPTLAAIHGVCAGGGLEMALACKYRVARRSATQLGLPEITLGLFPGWGAIIRLPPLIGLEASLQLILEGKMISADEALEIGLIDAIIEDDDFEYKLDGLINEWLKKESQLPQQRALIKTDNPDAVITAWKRKMKHSPAALAALNLISLTYPLAVKEGLSLQEKAFIDHLAHGFTETKNLIKNFFNRKKK